MRTRRVVSYLDPRIRSSEDPEITRILGSRGLERAIALGRELCSASLFPALLYQGKRWHSFFHLSDLEQCIERASIVSICLRLPERLSRETLLDDAVICEVTFKRGRRPFRRFSCYFATRNLVDVKDGQWMTTTDTKDKEEMRDDRE